jgi:AraC-like DNA-binding protein
LAEKEIAARLGYGSLNSFIRAFRRWNGVTPGEWRSKRATLSQLVSSAVPRLS